MFRDLYLDEYITPPPAAMVSRVALAFLFVCLFACFFGL